MGSGGIFADLVATCRERGSDIDAREFGQACQRLARTLNPEWDEFGTPGHLDVLLDRGDKFAAILTLLPDHWGYSIERDPNLGPIRASVHLPGRGPQEQVVSDDEGAALLGAIAAALGATGNVTALR